MRLNFFLIILPSVVTGFVSSSFDQFLNKYNKVYKSDIEYQTKKINYEKNIERIKYHNSLNKSFKLGENQFTDENIGVLKKNLFQNTFYPLNHFQKSVTNDYGFKKKLFWDRHVTRVKNQGQCGSCWAFSAVGSIESLLSIQNNETLENLSEQHLVDCSKRNYGCNGGLMHIAFEDITEIGGLALEQDYPYVGKKQDCKITKKKYLSSDFSYQFVEPHNMNAMLCAIQKNPLCVAVAADLFEFIFYKEGIFDFDNPDLRLSHAVLLTGYDLRGNNPYWKLKNSWSKEWGENGYMRIKMSEGRGVVGVNEYVLFPEFKKKLIK